MYKIGLINKSGNQTFVEKYIDSVITNDDDIVTIESSDIVFYFEDIKLLPNNTFDTKNLHNLVESWGYCFENEIPVHGKTFVIGCNVNKGEIQSIHEILNPMNIDIVYLPPTKDVDDGKIILGTLNQFVLSKLSSVLGGMDIKNLSITNMSFSSSEITNLLDSNFRYLKLTYKKMIEELCEKKDEINLIEKFINLEDVHEDMNMKLKNEVLSTFITVNESPINFPSDINNNLENDLIFNLNQTLDQNSDTSIPLIIDGVTYVNDPTNTNNRKIFGILQLLKQGYTIHILESEDFLKSKKMVSEFYHDYKEKVKFYKKGTVVDGVRVNL
jgi:hypothetical protein